MAVTTQTKSASKQNWWIFLIPMLPLLRVPLFECHAFGKPPAAQLDRYLIGMERFPPERANSSAERV
jgi:hypothetical protein